MQDRPITPNPQYLKLISQTQQPNNTHSQFLKKSMHPILSCNKYPKFNKTIKHSNKLTKAQIYQSIRAKNRKMFGQHKHIQQPIRQIPKIKPSAITVNYKPKKPYIQLQQNKQQLKKYSKPKQQPNLEQINKKKYEKMIENLKKQIVNFQQEKQEFNKLKDTLEFKKSLKNNFENPIKQGVKYIIHQKEDNNSTKKIIKSIAKQGQQISQQEDQVLKTQLKVSIESLNDIQFEELKDLKNYINIQNLNYDHNEKYKEAINCMQGKRLNIKQINNKRVSQIQKGWIEVWKPGQWRLLTDKKGYKITWFNNGDVKQQFYTGVQTYWSQKSNILQLKTNKANLIYYYPDLGQIQRVIDKNKREILFKDGRNKIIDI